MKSKQSTLIGYAWYKRNQWAILKAVVSDPENIEESYEDWLPNAEKSFAELKQSGENIRKVEVDIDELVSWCRAKGMPINGAARAQYAAEMVRHKTK